MLRVKVIFTLLIIIGSSKILWGQERVRMVYTNLNSEELGLDTLLFVSNDSLQFYLTSLKDRLNQEGFLEAGVDSIGNTDSLEKHVYFNIGKKLSILKLRADDDVRRLFNLSGVKEENLESIVYSPESVLKLWQKALIFLENNGYPFAEVRLADIHSDGDILSARIHLEKGNLIKFDTLEIMGDAKVSLKFLRSITEIKEGNPYNEKLIRQLDRRLLTLPFVRITRPSQVFFMGKKAKLLLYIDHKNNDVVDGIIGIAPPADGGLTPNQNLLITGEVRLRFGNLFRGGQVLDINWRSFKERSQELKAKTDLPFLFGSNIGIDLGVHAVKFDTLFSQFAGRIGLNYHLNGTDKIKIYYERQGTTLITADTLRIKNSRRLPQNQNMAIVNYGLETSINHLNYFFNPQRGFKLDAGIATGVKNIRRDSRINSLVLEAPGGIPYNIYDSTIMRMIQYRYQFNFEKYFKTGKSTTIKTALAGEGLYAPEIYFNELIRFGGIYSLRGFNEQSLFASSYTMLTLEFRYLLGQNSNVFMFWNGAYYQDNSVVRETRLTDLPFGFGGGANLETGAGIFTIAYALGRELNNPIRFQAGKVHFGLTGLF